MIIHILILFLPVVGVGAGYYSGPPAATHDKHKAPPSEPADGQVNASVPGACTMRVFSLRNLEFGATGAFSFLFGN